MVEAGEGEEEVADAIGVELGQGVGLSSYGLLHDMASIAAHVRHNDKRTFKGNCFAGHQTSNTQSGASLISLGYVKRL